MHIRHKSVNSGSGAPQGAGLGGLTPAEFASNVRECHRTVWTIAASILRDSNAADDAVQEASLVALAKLADFHPGTRFEAWFGQIVRFVALNHARRRHHPPPLTEDHVAQPQANPAANPARFDDRVSAALAQLDEVPRTCLLMRTIHGMTFAQIAAALDIPEGTAMSHVHRARALLRERLASIAQGGAR
jgi:RNA polymerase sigma-70 factor, ECF subfamily